jgi:hypothetical protein
MVELFRRCLDPNYSVRKFDWLYLESPHGVAHAWVAEDGERGELVGAAGAFPRKLCSEGREIAGLVLGDFCLTERLRSLGPALQLQRACMGGALESPFEFFYDFPSLPMMAVYKRMGVSQSGALKRWARPLRARRLIQRVVKWAIPARLLASIADVFLARRGWQGAGSDCELSLQKGPCGEEYTTLDRRLCMQAGLRTSRSAGYINWRYLAHPSVEHEILAGRRGKELVGYVVFTSGGEDPEIVDLCASDEGVAARLLGGAGKTLRERGAVTVSLNAGETHPWSALFERAGFRGREASPIVACKSPEATIREADWTSNWYIMRGERDC